MIFVDIDDAILRSDAKLLADILPVVMENRPSKIQSWLTLAINRWSTCCFGNKTAAMEIVDCIIAHTPEKHLVCEKNCNDCPLAACENYGVSATHIKKSILTRGIFKNPCLGSTDWEKVEASHAEDSPPSSPDDTRITIPSESRHTRPANTDVDPVVEMISNNPLVRGSHRPNYGTTNNTCVSVGIYPSASWSTEDCVDECEACIPDTHTPSNPFDPPRAVDGVPLTVSLSEMDSMSAEDTSAFTSRTLLWETNAKTIDTFRDRDAMIRIWSAPEGVDFEDHPSKIERFGLRWSGKITFHKLAKFTRWKFKINISDGDFSTQDGMLQIDVLCNPPAVPAAPSLSTKLTDEGVMATFTAPYPEPGCKTKLVCRPLESDASTGFDVSVYHSMEFSSVYKKGRHYAYFIESKNKFGMKRSEEKTFFFSK